MDNMEGNSSSPNDIKLYLEKYFSEFENQSINIEERIEFLLNELSIFKTAEEISQTGFFVIDPENWTVVISDITLKILTCLPNKNSYKLDEFISCFYETDHEPFKDFIFSSKPDIENTIIVKSGQKINQTKFIKSGVKYILLPNGKKRIVGTIEDITQEKKDEEFRRITEIRFSNLLRLTEMKGKSLSELMDYVNEAALKITDSKVGYIYFYSEETQLFTLYSWSKEVFKDCAIINPETTYDLKKTGIWGEVVRQRRAMIENDFDIPNELMKGYPEGHVKIKRWMSIPQFYNGEIVAVLGVANKLTDYDEMDLIQVQILFDSAWKIIHNHQIEVALSESERKYHSIFNNSPIGIFHTSKEGNFIDLNDTFAQILGFKNSSEILSDKKQNIYDFYYGPIERHKLLNVLENIEGFKTFEKLFRRKNKEVFFGEMSVRAIKEGNNIVLLEGMLQDVTIKRRQEEKIKQNLNRQKLLSEVSQQFSSIKNFDEMINESLRLIGEHLGVSRVYIFEDSKDGMFTTNTFEWCNIGISPQISNLWNIPYSTIPSLKKIFKEFGILKTSNIYDLPQDLIDSLEPQDIKSILGIPLSVKNNFFGFMGFDECITNIIWNESEIELLKTIANIFSNAYEKNMINIELQELNKNKDKFFSILAHDLKNPLNAFLGLTEMLSDTKIKIEESEVREISQTLNDSAQKLYKLLNNLLQWSRLQRGAMDFIPSEFNLKEVTEQALKVLGANAITKKIRINNKIPDDYMVKLDPNMYSTIIRNVIGNGIKFSFNDSEIDILFEKKETDGFDIKIVDHGIGMDGATLNKLFIVGEKISEKGTAGEEGSGLGLILSNDFMKMHRGSIEVLSKVGKGTTFILHFPGRNGIN